jgi:LPXTG-motif cell wall-anchored protein
MRGHVYPKSENFVGLSGAEVSKTAQVGTKAGNAASIASAVGEIAASTITALATVKDLKLRREYEMRVADLTSTQQANLSKLLLKAQTADEKRKVFADLLSSTSAERIKALSPKTNNNIIWYIVGGVVILGASFFIYKKFKK